MMLESWVYMIVGVEGTIRVTFSARCFMPHEKRVPFYCYCRTRGCLRVIKHKRGDRCLCLCLDRVRVTCRAGIRPVEETGVNRK